ncbi:MAG: hypothetical protein ACYC2T_15945 [Bacillota bacterium]
MMQATCNHGCRRGTGSRCSYHIPTVTLDMNYPPKVNKKTGLNTKTHSNGSNVWSIIMDQLEGVGS